jgi:ADP-ribosylation factor-like protein 8
MFDNPDLKGIPLLVIGNKIDVLGHLREPEIVEEMNLDYLQNNHWVLVMASALKGTNVETVLDWLIKKSKN